MAKNRAACDGNGFVVFTVHVFEVFMLTICIASTDLVKRSEQM